jgi:3',5'-cyclic AMP phosphodiesterase CpdA
MHRLLIVSDLHVSEESSSDSGPSLISVHPDGKKLGECMFNELVRAIKLEDCDIDWIVCPGDLGDKANRAGQEYAWEKLTWVKVQLNAKHLIGTAGNHDFDSRLITADFDPRANLQSLTPFFPGVSQADCDKYWSRHFCIHNHDGMRVVNLNSSAYHGNATGPSGPEHLHGRVAAQTVDHICEEIKDQTATVNVLVTHHHLTRNDHIYDRDNSEMSGAGKLIKKLTDTTNSPWLVIHGHQHYPEIDYGRGSALAPIIISAGSFSARMSGVHAMASPNQFYVVEIAAPSQVQDGWYPCGTVRAWNWTPERFWEKSPTVHRIPYGAGFGCRMNPTQSARRVLSTLESSAEPYLTLQDILVAEPILGYMLPKDFGLLVWQLEQNGVKVTKTLSALDTTFRKVGAR